MAKADTGTADTDLEAAFAQATRGGRVKVRRGRRLAAMVPVADLERLEELDRLEDEALGRAAMAALAEHEASGEDTIPWEVIKARHSL